MSNFERNLTQQEIIDGESGEQGLDNIQVSKSEGSSPWDIGKSILRKMTQIHEGENPTVGRAAGNIALNLLGIGNGLRAVKKNESENTLSKAAHFGKGFIGGWLKQLLPQSGIQANTGDHLVTQTEEQWRYVSEIK